MRLVKDWRKIIARAWSVRLLIAGAVLQGAALYWTAFEGTIPPGPFFAAGILLQVAATLSRVIDQGLSHDPPEAP